MKRQVTATSLALAVAGTSALWTVQAAAQTDNSEMIKQMQQQIQMLQQQVQELQKKQSAAPAANTTTTTADNGDLEEATKPSKVADSGPTQKLNIGGGVAVEYQERDGDIANRRDGGDFIFDYFSINAAGQYGKLTYAAEERFSSVNFADSSFLHYGWAAYDFNDHNQVKGGYFNVPFGNLGLSYQTFWGSLAYFAGFSDNQAAGIGYKYENGPFRLDVDAFKNDDLEQNSLYGSNPFQGYQQVNGGNVRLGYTFNHQGDNTLNVSAAVRGGELEVGTSGVDRGVTSDYGTRWAATAAADAKLGLWTLQGQFVDYKYNIPNGRTFGGNALPTDAITVENYGFGYQMPASGQLYGFNVARDFPVDIGPISNIQLYDNYGYINVGGDGEFTSSVPGADLAKTGDIQFNAIGAALTAGPAYLWADMLFGKNAAMTFIGPNDGDWHPRFNLTAAFYFDGDVIK